MYSLLFLITSFSRWLPLTEIITTICFVSFVLFGFQWAFWTLKNYSFFIIHYSLQSLWLCLVGPSGLEPPLNLISRFAREKPLTLLKGSFYLVLLVGPSGLEPPTSCLSGTRSNLLSYEPLWLVWHFFTLRFWTLNSEYYSLFIFHHSLRSKASLGGDDGIRTHDPLLAGQVLSQLSYTPKLISEEWMMNN